MVFLEKAQWKREKKEPTQSTPSSLIFRVLPSAGSSPWHGIASLLFPQSGLLFPPSFTRLIPNHLLDLSSRVTSSCPFLSGKTSLTQALISLYLSSQHLSKPHFTFVCVTFWLPFVPLLLPASDYIFQSRWSMNICWVNEHLKPLRKKPMAKNILQIFLSLSKVRLPIMENRSWT